jgi:hypothetical protein
MDRRRLLALLLLLPLLLAGAIALVPPAPEDSLRSEQWTAILSGRFTPDGTGVEECADSERPTYCYAQAFANIAYRDGATLAMSRLLEASVAASDALADCHAVAHLVGSASYYRLENDFGAAIATGSRECAGGYYHGVIAAEAATNPSNDPEVLGSRLARMCREAASDAGPRNECYHGIGHVAEHLYDYETPTALRACAAMRTTIRALGADEDEDRTAFFSCAQGTFMENRQALGGPDQRWRRDGDPTYPCSEFDEEIGISCWDTVPGDIVRDDDESLIEHALRRFEVCERASLESWADRCSEIARRLVINDEATTDELVAICSGDPAGARDCLRSIASESMIRWSSTERSGAVCAAAAGSEQRNDCGTGIGEGLHYIALPIERCDELADDLVAPCREGYVLMERQAFPTRTGD